MSKLIFTGTSSGYPSKTRACSSFVIKHNNKLYQFDAGEGFSRSAMMHRIATDNIAKIFISHLHPDHIAGLFLELQKMYLDNRSQPLDIYVPKEEIDGLSKTVDMFYLFKEKFPFKFRFKPIEPGPIYNGNKICVNAYPTAHLYPNYKLIRKYHKPNKMASYSFEIEISTKTIFYSGDLRTENEIADLMSGIDIAIVEGMHIDAETLFYLANHHKIKKLILTHLPDKIANNPKRLQNIAEKYGIKRLVIAVDGMAINL